MLRLALCVLMAALLIPAGLACPRAPKAAPGKTPTGQGLRETRILLGQDTIRAEVASTEETRRVGLMYRLGMAENDGMLFVFDEPAIYPFWMRNTEFPLSIAFFDSDRRIVDIQDMAPHDVTTLHAPPGPVLYALEMNQGWFKTHGVGVGDRVTMLTDSAR